MVNATGRWALLGLCLWAGGCTGEYWQQRDADKGLVVILPGIQGEDGLTQSIQSGLDGGGVDRAMVVQNWGKPIPIAGLLLNQVDFIGCRIDAGIIAGKIMAYQNKYPQRPVHVIGHSAGGAVAVFVAEALADQPKAEPIDGLVLLSASISSGYDLTKALRVCKQGILNCYNPEDVGMLGVATTILGNLDGGHGPSAGLNGFHLPLFGDREETRAAYATKLVQKQVPSYGGPHFSSTNADFISGTPSRWILNEIEPDDGSRVP